MEEMSDEHPGPPPPPPPLLPQFLCSFPCVGDGEEWLLVVPALVEDRFPTVTGEDTLRDDGGVFPGNACPIKLTGLRLWLGHRSLGMMSRVEWD